MSGGTSQPGHALDGWGTCLPSPFIPEAASPLPDTLLQGALAFPGPSQLRPRLPIPRGRQQLASQTRTVSASTAPGPDPTPDNHRMEKSWSWHCSPLPVRSLPTHPWKERESPLPGGRRGWARTRVLSGDCGERIQIADDQAKAGGKQPKRQGLCPRIPPAVKLQLSVH